MSESQEPLTEVELIELARLSLGGLGRAAKAVTQKAGMELGTVKGYTQMRGGKRVTIRQHRRNYDPADLRAMQGRPSLTAKPGILPQGRSGPKSFPALQANHVQEEVQARAKAVIEKVSKDPTLSAALRNSAIGDKNLVNGMSPDQARQIVDSMMTGREGTPQEAFHELQDMLGQENVPRRPAPRPPAKAAIQGAPPTKSSWQYRDMPHPVPRSERAVGKKVKHPSLGVGEVREYTGQGKLNVRFDKEPNMDTRVSPEDLTMLEEVNNWEEVGPLRPGEKHDGKIVRSADGRLARISRPGPTSGSSMVNTEDGMPDLWWHQDLTEVRPPKRDVLGERARLPGEGEQAIVNQATGETIPHKVGDPLPPGFEPVAAEPGQIGRDKGSELTPGPEFPGTGGSPNREGQAGLERTKGPGSSSFDWPGTYFPGSAQSWGPKPEPNTWIDAETGREYGWEAETDYTGATKGRYLIDYGVPGERDPYSRPKIIKRAPSLEEQINQALEEQRKKEEGSGKGRGKGRGKRPGPDEGIVPGIPGKPRRPSEREPTIFRPQAPSTSDEGAAAGRRDAFMIESRNWFGNAKLTPEQKTLAKQILYSKSPEEMTADERQFMKDAYGPMWEKTAARSAKWFPSLHRDAARRRKAREGLSMMEKVRATTLISMDDPLTPNGESVFKNYMEDPGNIKDRIAVEKAFGKDWQKVRAQLLKYPKGDRQKLAKQTMEEIQRTNWGHTQEDAEMQYQRLQDIFGEDKVKAVDLHNPTVQERLQDFAKMDDRQLQMVARYWDRERRRTGDPEFGQIHIGDRPLSQLDKFDQYLVDNNLAVDSWDKSAGVHLMDKGMILIGTEDTSSTSVAIHEMSHAMDAAMGFYSRTPEFRHAHDSVSKTLGKALDSYYGKNEDGPGEMFAEVSAAWVTGWDQGLRGDDLSIHLAGAVTGGRGDTEKLIKAGQQLEEIMGRVQEGSLAGDGSVLEHPNIATRGIQKWRPFQPIQGPEGVQVQEGPPPLEEELPPVPPGGGGAPAGEPGQVPGMFEGPFEQGPGQIQGAPGPIPEQPNRKPPENREPPAPRGDRPYSDKLTPLAPDRIEELLNQQLGRQKQVLAGFIRQRHETNTKNLNVAEHRLADARELLMDATEGKVPMSKSEVDELYRKVDELMTERDGFIKAQRDIHNSSATVRKALEDANELNRSEGRFLTDGVNVYTAPGNIENPDTFQRDWMEEAAGHLQRIQENLPANVEGDNPYVPHEVNFMWKEDEPQSMDPAERYKNAAAWGVRGGRQMWLDISSMNEGYQAETAGLPNPLTENNPGHTVPEAQDLPFMQYVMTHEFGHNVDTTTGTGTARDQALERLFKSLNRSNMPSGYSMSSPAEMVAEAFTAWMWGDRSNPIVAQIADIMGWDQEYIPPPPEPPEDSQYFSRRSVGIHA